MTIPDELVEQLDALAARNDRTRTLEITRAIRKHLETAARCEPASPSVTPTAPPNSTPRQPERTNSGVENLAAPPAALSPVEGMKEKLMRLAQEKAAREALSQEER